MTTSPTVKDVLRWVWTTEKTQRRAILGGALRRLEPFGPPDARQFYDEAFEASKKYYEARQGRVNGTTASMYATCARTVIDSFFGNNTALRPQRRRYQHAQSIAEIPPPRTTSIPLSNGQTVHISGLPRTCTLSDMTKIAVHLATLAVDFDPNRLPAIIESFAGKMS